MAMTKNALRVVAATTDLTAARSRVISSWRRCFAAASPPANGRSARRIPNVDDLAAEFDVARGTMREALGLLERRACWNGCAPRAPSCANRRSRRMSHKLAIDWQSLISAHEGAKIEVLEHRVVTELPAVDRMKGVPAAKYQMMRRLHLRDDRPYLVGRFYLEYELFKKGPPLEFRRLPTLPILHRSPAPHWQGLADVDHRHGRCGNCRAAANSVERAGGQGRSHRSRPRERPLCRSRRLSRRRHRHGHRIALSGRKGG